MPPTGEQGSMSTRVFVTGATGYLGSAIAARIVRAGHDVYGLTRRPERASALAAIGVKPVIGDLDEPNTYLSALKNCDVAVHTAVAAKDADLLDMHALEAFRVAAEDGRVRRLLYTSGVWVYGDTGGRIVDESTPLNPLQLVKWRAAHEEVALDLVDQEVSVVVFRPAIVYGESRGIIGAMFDMAREKHEVVWPGNGEQHWGLVHRDDIAEAYRLGLDYARGGERYVLVDDSQLTARQVAEDVAAVTGVPAHGWDRADVVRKLGAFGEALMTSTRTTSALARRELGWVPRHPSFQAEIRDLYREWQDSQEAPVV
jgi:nucleoside-diphosphate-sugar epimerase